MPLDPATRDRVIAEAKRRGVDPDAAIAAAEKVAPKSDAPSDKPASGDTTRPIADRLLIGFLPYIKVRELRAIWLGLPFRMVRRPPRSAHLPAPHPGTARSPAPAEPPA